MLMGVGIIASDAVYQIFFIPTTARISVICTVFFLAHHNTYWRMVSEIHLCILLRYKNIALNIDIHILVHFETTIKKISVHVQLSVDFMVTN